MKQKCDQIHEAREDGSILARGVAKLMEFLKQRGGTKSKIVYIATPVAEEETVNAITDWLNRNCYNLIQTILHCLLYNVLHNVLHKILHNDLKHQVMMMCNKLRNTDIKILSSLHLQTFFDHFYSECDVTSRDWLDLLSILEQVGFSFNLRPLYNCFPGGGVQKHSIYSISCIELEFKCTAATVDRRSRQTRCHQLAITWCVIWSILPLLMTTSWSSKVILAMRSRQTRSHIYREGTEKLPLIHIFIIQLPLCIIILIYLIHLYKLKFYHYLFLVILDQVDQTKGHILNNKGHLRR